MSYNGWKNYETWNVALWIGGDEGLYQLAKDCENYRWFVETLEEIMHPADIAMRTPDGVSWRDFDLDLAALDEMIGEL